MKQYFKVDAKFNRTDEVTGDIKEVAESYLFEAVNFGDAEALSAKELAKITEGKSFHIVNIAKFRVNHIINPDGAEIFWLAKSQYTLEQERGKVKKVVEIVLVNAENITLALDDAKAYYAPQNAMLPTEIISVAETKIKEVFSLAPAPSALSEAVAAIQELARQGVEVSLSEDQRDPQESEEFSNEELF